MYLEVSVYYCSFYKVERSNLEAGYLNCNCLNIKNQNQLTISNLFIVFLTVS